MGAFGLGLLFAAIAGAAGWVLALNGGKAAPVEPGKAPIKGDGNAGQNAAPGFGTTVNPPGTYEGSGATGVAKAGATQVANFDQQPVPVQSGYVPRWTNPKSSDVPVE